MATATLPTEVEVLQETLKWFRNPDHFTASDYQELVEDAPDGVWDRHQAEIGPYVCATCAIGGVEHAIWRLTRGDVREARGLVKNPEPQTRSRKPLLRLYVGVMGHLNAVARRLYGDESPYDGEGAVQNIEQVTFISEWTEEERREAVRNVIRTALREARALAKAAA